MFGVPRSSAPFTKVALIRLAEGLLIPATSRRYSRANAAEPPATAVACEVPLSSMYIDLELLWVPVAQTVPTTLFASSARAEQIPSPGATKSGLIRPSKAGPCEDDELTLPLLLEPMANTFFAVAGAVIWEAPFAPLSPTEKTGKRY